MNSFYVFENFILVLLFAMYLLWLIIQPITRDKKVRKVDHSLAIIALLFLNANALIQNSFNYYSLIVFVVSLSLAALAVRYLHGDKYHVNTPLDMSLKNIIKEILIENNEGSNLNLTEDPEGKVKIEIVGKPSYITLISARKFPYGEPYGILSFFKWKDRSSKNRILDQIAIKLQHGNFASGKSNQRLQFKLGLSLLIIIAVSLYGNFVMVRYMESTIRYSDTYPNQIFVTELDRNITDSKNHKTTEINDLEEIKRIYEKYQNQQKILMKSFDLDNKMMNFYTVIQLQEPSKRIYIGNYETYLIVDYEKDITWPQLSISLFRIFERDAYSVYRIYD